MNAEDLEGLPVSSGGHVLSCEEITCLQAGLTLLKATEKNPVIQFWGKILGKERDYFIACEIRDMKPSYPNKRFFYAGEDFKFKAMPDLSEEVGEAVSMLQLTTPLTGDPSALLESVAGVEPKAGPALTELDRLALLVQEIDFDTATVPKGAYSLNEAQVVVPNSAFRGLEPAKATLLQNYVHFRPPASVVSLKAQASNDLEFQSNFLDSLADDLPKGCWAVRQEPEKSGLVTLRSLSPSRTGCGQVTQRFTCLALASLAACTSAMLPRSMTWPSCSEAERRRLTQCNWPEGIGEAHRVSLLTWNSTASRLARD
eukprot:s1503_g6.t2